MNVEPDMRALARARDTLVRTLGNGGTGGASLFSGTAGLVWAVTHLSMRDRPASYADAIACGLDPLMAEFDGLVQSGRALTAAAGIALAIVHADHAWSLGLAPGLADEFDGLLLGELRSGASAIPKFDLTDGLAGIGAYALYRATEHGETTLLESLVDTLLERATDDGTLSWRSTPALLRGTPMGMRHPQGCVDLGVAHGQGGPIVLIAKAILAAPALRMKFSEPLRRALAGLRRHAHAADAGAASRFGYVAGDGATARCAWCYGDLGLASAFTLAGLALGSAEYLAEGAELARAVARMSPAQRMVSDSWLCHGSAGAALLLGRLARFHDCPLVADASRTFVDASFVALRLATDDDPLAHGSPGFLEGVAGLALACNELQASLAPTSVDWALPLLVLPAP